MKDRLTDAPLNAVIINSCIDVSNMTPELAAKVTEELNQGAPVRLNPTAEQLPIGKVIKATLHENTISVQCRILKGLQLGKNAEYASTDDFIALLENGHATLGLEPSFPPDKGSPPDKGG